MQIEIAEETCRLCKRPIEGVSSSSDATRLCDECQSIVQGMAPGAQSPIPAVSSQPQTQLVKPSATQPRFQTLQDQQPTVIVPPLETKSMPPSGPIDKPSSGPLEELAELFADTTPTTGPLTTPQPRSTKPPAGPPFGAFTNPPAGQPPVYLAPPPESTIAVNAPGNQWSDSTTQPANQWPLLLEQRQESKTARRSVTMLVAILAFLLAGVGGYFLFTRLLIKRPAQDRAQMASAKTDSIPQAAKPAVNDGSSATAAPNQQPVNQAGDTEKTTAQQQASQNQSSAVAAPQGSGAPKGEGAFTLQAASFPNEAAAKQFSERLIRAGISAYVLPADIPRRGRWFRVRAGRFGSADEAGRYATQSKQRAIAAGLTLQLIVCGYEQP
jgi:sporulation related protein